MRRALLIMVYVLRLALDANFHEKKHDSVRTYTVTTGGKK